MTRSNEKPRVRRWLVAFTATALIAALGVIPGASVAAAGPTNMVLVWNENAINVIGAATAPPVTTPPTPPGLGQGPPISALHLAMVHGAIYDAVNAIDKKHEPYLKGLSARSSASKPAAVAQAAHDVLVGLTPTTLPLVKARVDDMLTASLALIDDGRSKTRGVKIGREAAAAMLLARTGDGRFGTYSWAESNAVGKWRPVLPLLNNAFGWFAKVKPLTMKSTDQFRTKGPLELTSAKYAREFNEVKSLGAQSGSSRTAAQTLLAGFVTANPLPFMNKGLREIAVARRLSTSQQARLFVKTSMGGADALIGCFDDKDHWNLWRPQTAIREALNDGNAATSPNPDWLSVFPPPPYSDHPSGYNCFTGGFWHSARLFFGTDRITFQLTSPGVPTGVPVAIPGSTRSYTRLTGVINDTIEGRILNGFHFRTADVQGARLGKNVAQWIDKHYFEREDEDDDDD